MSWENTSIKPSRSWFSGSDGARRTEGSGVSQTMPEPLQALQFAWVEVVNCDGTWPLPSHTGHLCGVDIYQLGKRSSGDSGTTRSRASVISAGTAKQPSEVTVCVHFGPSGVMYAVFMATSLSQSSPAWDAFAGVAKQAAALITGTPPRASKPNCWRKCRRNMGRILVNRRCVLFNRVRKHLPSFQIRRINELAGRSLTNRSRDDSDPVGFARLARQGEACLLPNAQHHRIYRRTVVPEPVFALLHIKAPDGPGSVDRKHGLKPNSSPPASPT